MRCLTCDTALPADADPRRKTCSNACRQRRYRQRREALLVRAAFEEGTRRSIAEQAEKLRAVYRDAGLVPPF